ncbi:MAG TPA: ribonuclease, partial [Arthrobacter sp.]
MRNRSILPLLLTGLVVLALFAFGGNGFLGQLTESTTPEAASTAEPAPGAASGTPAAPAPPAPAPENPSGLPEVRESALPAEGRRILNLIRAGGPYRYSQDDQ